MSNRLRHFNTDRRKLRYATILAITTLTLSGCAKEQTQATNKEPSKQQALTDDPYQQAIVNFRNDITKKKRAKFFLGACVAWPNALEGITVTVNPGIAEIPESEESVLMFSATEDKKAKNPELHMMNGPDVGSETVLTLAFDPGVRGSITRNIKDKPKKFKNGQLSYVDKESGIPLSNTVVMPDTPPVVEVVEEVCTALRKDKLIPKFKKIELPSKKGNTTS